MKIGAAWLSKAEIVIVRRAFLDEGPALARLLPADKRERAAFLGKLGIMPEDAMVSKAHEEMIEEIKERPPWQDV